MLPISQYACEIWGDGHAREQATQKAQGRSQEGSRTPPFGKGSLDEYLPSQSSHQRSRTKKCGNFLRCGIETGRWNKKPLEEGLRDLLGKRSGRMHFLLDWMTRLENVCAMKSFDEQLDTNFDVRMTELGWMSLSDTDSSPKNFESSD